MERRTEITYRMAVEADALCLSVLATHVFLDTYATQGIRPAIARVQKDQKTYFLWEKMDPLGPPVASCRGIDVDKKRS